MRHTPWLALAASAWAPPAQAALVISEDPTHAIKCVSGQCFPKGPNAVLNVGDLQSYLQNGNVYVSTRNYRTNVDAGDMRVEAPVQWNTASALNLTASRLMLIKRKILVDGTGSLYLFGGYGGVVLGSKARIRFRDKHSQLRVENIQYTLVKNVREMARVAATATGFAGAALMDSYDASSDGIYTSAPVRPVSVNFSVEGLGNTLSNITIVEGKNPKPGNVGLISTASEVLNLHVINIAVTANIQSGGYVGGIVGQASTLVGDTVTGSVSASGLTAGGLVGRANSILSSAAHVAVTATVAGGLVGEDDGASIQLSSASGPVISEGGVAGGLVGHLSGGTIQQSFATGSVSGQDDRRVVLGGLVGLLDSGSSDGSISTVVNCYAFGALTARGGSIGGLAGTILESNTTSAYATGMIGGNGGGYIGKNQFSTNQSAYWDTAASGTRRGAGNGSESGIVGRTTKQLKAALPSGFDPAFWAENAMINNGYPYLIANPPQ